MTEYIEVTPETPRVRTGQIKLYGPEAFEGMRAAGRVSAQVLAALEAEVRPGVTTKSLDDFARDMIISLGATPANLGYRGFAHTTCISINHVVCHGLPSDRVLKDVAGLMSAVLRDEDIIARWGGEEFLLMLPECDVREGAFVVERIRKVIETAVFPYEDRQVAVTVTLGVAELDPELGFDQSIKNHTIGS